METTQMGFLTTKAAFQMQDTMDAAVVIPTTCRPTLRRALESVYAQNFQGRIHVLVGIDVPRGELSMPEAPSHIAVQVLYPGYSTSTRHGGLAAPGDGT